jgi:type I restriction enzyme S subunit
MEVKPGYKQTEVGVIPEKWEVKSIEQIAFVTSGKRLPLGSSLVKHPTPHPYIRVTDMRPGTVSLDEIQFVPEIVFPAIKRYRIYCDDIFISVAGSLGIVGKVPKELDGANLTENADRITKITCSQDYLLNVLMSPLIQSTIDSIQTVGAQPKLALTRIRKFSIPHPPLSEQRAIAAALSDVDGLLGGLDRLIAKKRDLKQAAMQQLLTGQTRLPGFEGGWEIRALGDIANIKTGSRNNEDKIEDGEYPFFVRSEVIERINSYSHDSEAILVPGEGRIGSIFHYINGKFDVHQRVYAITHFSSSVLPRFIHYYMKQYFGDWAMQNTVKATVDSLRLPTFQNFEMRIPAAIEEQVAIATVLSEMDAESLALEERRNKTADLKQAMMQELLTGRTRLI